MEFLPKLELLLSHVKCVPFFFPLVNYSYSIILPVYVFYAHYIVTEFYEAFVFFLTQRGNT